VTVKRSTMLAAALAAVLCTGGTVPALDLGRLLDAGKDLATASTGLSEPDEIAVGREIAGRMLGAAPLVADPAVQSYVNRVGRWVALQAERPDLPWRFGVIDSPTINAFAAPGGYVLITRGLYEILDNESQLAGVLGHEIGHIVKRHHITVMQQSAAVSAGARLVQQSRNALVNNLIGTGAEVMARGLDKSAEFEADQIGVILAARAGYSPTGLVDVLHKMSARGSNDASLALLFKTHPSPGERLTQLGDALAPRMPELPPGREPQIRQVSADAVPAAASQPIPGAGTRALTQEEAAPQPTSRPAQKGSGTGIGVDPGSVLRGIFGR
jgi:predicted Zn-dependent protease